MRGAVQIGKVGELLAQAIFESFGYKTALVNHEGFDLIVLDDDSNSYRVEVKAASNQDGTSRRYNFMTSRGSRQKRIITDDDADIICYVALDTRRIVVRCVRTITKKKTKVSCCEFEVDENAQIRRAFTEVKKRR